MKVGIAPCLSATFAGSAQGIGKMRFICVCHWCTTHAHCSRGDRAKVIRRP